MHNGRTARPRHPRFEPYARDFSAQRRTRLEIGRAYYAEVLCFLSRLA